MQRLERIALAAAMLLALAGGAIAQAPQAPQAPMQLQAPAAPAAQPQENRGMRPGFIDALGHWIQNSVTSWNSGVQDATGVARDAANAAGTVTRDTAGAVVRIPGTRVIAERATCPVAPNGAPDCRAAAEAICRQHGFASGSSIDFQTARKCPPIALNRDNGDPPPPCVLESYVTRSLCQ